MLVQEEIPQSNSVPSPSDPQISPPISPGELAPISAPSDVAPAQPPSPEELPPPPSVQPAPTEALSPQAPQTQSPPAVSSPPPLSSAPPSATSEPPEPQSLIHSLLQKAREKLELRRRKKLDRILVELSAKGKITNREIKKLIRVSEATATRYMNILEKKEKCDRLAGGRGATTSSLNERLMS